MSTEQHTPVSDDPADSSSNDSGNRAFRDVLGATLSRRSVVVGGTAAAAGFLGLAGVGSADAGNPPATSTTTTAGGGARPAIDVLIRTRQPADAVGATPMDRPEWITVHPRTNDVYLTLTNSTLPPTSAVNPRNPNPYGHIIRWREHHGDHTSVTFTWDIFLLAGDPQYDPAVTLAEEDIFGSPDGLWFDPDGRLWIQTDVSNSSQNRPDRGYDRVGNNQMLVADPGTGEVRRFLVGPRGAEITGIDMTPDQRTMFVNVQHPGEATTFWGTPTPANPRAVSNWPDFDPGGRPRAATLVIRRHDGGVIGT